MRQINFLLNC